MKSTLKRSLYGDVGEGGDGGGVGYTANGAKDVGIL